MSPTPASSVPARQTRPTEPAHRPSVLLLADGVNYLQVTISDASYGLDPNAIRFDVTLLAPLTGIAGSNFGIQAFGFNTTQTPATVLAAITGLPGGGSVSDNANQDGFGKFELVNSGTGSNRQNPALTFYISGVSDDTLHDHAVLSSGNAGQGNVMFASQVAGFLDQDSGANQLTSAYFGGSAAAGTKPLLARSDRLSPNGSVMP